MKIIYICVGVHAHVYILKYIIKIYVNKRSQLVGIHKSVARHFIFMGFKLLSYLRIPDFELCKNLVSGNMNSSVGNLRSAR